MGTSTRTRDGRFPNGNKPNPGAKPRRATPDELAEEALAYLGSVVRSTRASRGERMQAAITILAYQNDRLDEEAPK